MLSLKKVLAKLLNTQKTSFIQCSLPFPVIGSTRTTVDVNIDKITKGYTYSNKIITVQESGYYLITLSPYHTITYANGSIGNAYVVSDKQGDILRVVTKMSGNYCSNSGITVAFLTAGEQLHFDILNQGVSSAAEVGYPTGGFCSIIKLYEN